MNRGNKTLTISENWTKTKVNAGHYLTWINHHQIMENQIENQIFERVKGMNSDQRSNVLDYIEKFPRANHSTKLRKRRALKQIRKALSDL